MGVSGVASRPANNGRAPRTPCDLCGEAIVWVEETKTGKRIAINPDPPAHFLDGCYIRGRGGGFSVEFVPENERWMQVRLYQKHLDTCPEWQSCRRQGVKFPQCRERAQKLRSTPVMTQTMREKKQPEVYARRRDL